MDNRYRVCTGLLIALMMASGCWPVWARDEKATPEEPAIPPLEEPENPAVEAILEAKPNTPAELTRAAKILADLGRPDLAKGFLQKVLGASLDQKQLAALQAQLGSRMFIEMASREELAPEGGQLAHAVLTAVNLELADPQRLAGLIKQLQDPSAEARYRAMDGLRKARSAAVAPLLAVLANPNRAAEHANVRAALLRLGSDAVGPLSAILEAPDPKLRVEAIRALGDLDAGRTIFFLLAPFASGQSDPPARAAAEAALLKLTGHTPTKPEAARLLAQQATRHFDRLEPLEEDPEGRVEMWSWDENKQQPVKNGYPSGDASRLLAARFAREAHSITPEDDQIRVLYLATMLEQAAYENGLDKPLGMASGKPAATAAEFGVKVIEAVLVYGMDSGHAAAATAAARILGRQAEAADLLYQGPQPAPLVKATRHADRRLRFAAVEAITTLGPSVPFAGSSYVLEALAFFAASSGSRRAMVAGPVTEESRRVAGYLTAMGYEVDTAVTGRQLIRLTIASPDYELALVAASLQQPTVEALLQRLRHDCRTARLPVGILARAGELERAEHIARNDPLAEAFSRPHTENTVQWQVGRLMGLVGRDMVPHAERLKQAAEALQWLAELSGQKQNLYNMQRVEEVVLAAQYVPQLGPKAVAVLGNLPGAKSQQALVDMASRWTQPLELRKAAAEAFRRSVEEHGILLTSGQIRLQYDRHRESAALDAAGQQVLASILDCIKGATQPIQESGRRKVEGGRKE